MIAISYNELIEFTRNEIDAIETSISFNNLLDISSLHNSGNVISNCEISKNKISLIRSVKFSFVYNSSKIRKGDRVSVVNSKRKFEGIVLSIGLKSIDIKISGFGNLDLLESYLIILRTDYLNILALKALIQMKENVQGWGLLLSFLGQMPIPPKIALPKTGKNLTSKPVFDSDFADPLIKDVFQKCLEEPYLLGIQGPPGTGKTTLLAEIAVGYVAQKKRILILAPTHLAVNNALSIIRAKNKVVEIVKLGDPLQNDGLSVGIRTDVYKSYMEEYRLRRNTPEPIIGMTFHSAIIYFSIRNNYFIPNCVLIDEAGQLALNLGVITGTFGASVNIFFGDHRQMAPIFPSELTGHPLAKSIFERLNETYPQLVYRLTQTYRMNDELTQTVTNLFYKQTDGITLSSSDHIKNRRFKVYPGNAELKTVRTMLDTDSFVLGVCESTDDEQMNHKEATMVFDLADDFIKYSGNVKSEIAIVTPYRKQVSLIRSKFLKSGYTDETIPLIDTVERVQGQTVEIILISLCASDLDFIENNSEFILSPNRLNVTFSRARTKVVLLLSPNYLHLPQTSIRLIEASLMMRYLMLHSKVVYF